MFAQICVAAVVGLAFAADLPQDAKNAVNEVTTTKDGDLFCPVPIVGTRCPDSSVFHYYKCCGDLNKDCCFNLQVSDRAMHVVLLSRLRRSVDDYTIGFNQTWVIVVLAVIAVIFVASFVLSICRCLFCRR
ncbi:hypothetical protein Q1695_014223 [Nippostrongylus brasiliensis]|nr:hypothetical protein Q1695_014223 [Nippostrongylus brasiliensis]